MPRLKKATDANGTTFYPITISKGVYDIERNQRLSDTLASLVSLTQLNTILADYIKTEIDIDGPIYVGTGNEVDDVIYDTGSIYNSIPENIPVSCVSEYLFFVYPASNSFTFNMLMSNLPVPMEEQEHIDIEGVDHIVMQSENEYSFTGNVQIGVLLTNRT